MGIPRHILNYGMGFFGTSVKFVEAGDARFKMTVTTTAPSETFIVPTEVSSSYACDVDWGDGNVETMAGYDDAKWTHTYADAGDHQIIIDGTFERIFFNDTGDRLKVKSLDNLGATGWTTFLDAFQGCTNMTSAIAGAGTETSTVENFGYMFDDCDSLVTADLTGMSMENATSINRMFLDCPNLTSVTFDSTPYSSATGINAPYVFRNDTLLETVDFGGLSTAKFTDLVALFWGADELTSANIENFDVSSCMNFTRSFSDITNTIDFDFSSWDFGSLQASGIRDFLDLSTLATPQYNDLLEALWNTVPNTAQIFDGGNSVASGAGLTAKNNLINSYGWTFATG